MRPSLWLGLSFLILTASIGLRGNAVDPEKTDGDKYKVVLENERVKVFRYDDRPGEKTHQHDHNDFVLYALGPFKRRLTFPDGKKISRDFKEGDVIWMKKQTHIGENIGTTDTHVLIVELKEPSKGTDKQVESDFK